MISKGSIILVVAAHPDDDILGSSEYRELQELNI